MDGEDPFDNFDDDDLQPETGKAAAKKKNARSKSTDNLRVIEMRKERSRNAARSRRGKENAQFDELAKLLPLPSAITSQLDKASIIRLTISYLSMREFSGTVPKRQLQLTDLSESGVPSVESAYSDVTPSPQPSVSREVISYQQASAGTGLSNFMSETGSQLLQALEGFLLVLSLEGKILYVSETVSINLGLSQVELTGNSIFNYIHQEDHQDLLEQLSNAANAESEGQFQGTQGFFPCQGQGDGLFNAGDQTEGPKLMPTQNRSFFLRMKCTLVRRGGSYAKSAGFKVVHCVGRVKDYATDAFDGNKKGFVVLAQPVPTMNINELPLECNMFVSRVNMDLKIVYCEGRVHKFMDYFAKDIVGISAYDFYHAGDVALIQGHHAKFLSKGQVWTKYYRWMNKNGGWVWMQTKASLIPHPSNPSLKQMLCLNYILSDVEHRSVVLGMAQLKDKPELASAPANILTEVPCDGDNTGELNDALIDDQVMVFPKWQATSDKLVPKQTLLDQMALQRTGYTKQFNESLNNWSNEHYWMNNDRKASQSDSCSTAEIDTDDKELQEIADIINAEVTQFDQSLLDFVVSGKTPALRDIPSSHLGPLGSYIEEIPQTTASSTSSFPKVETTTVLSDYGSTSTCTQPSRKRPAPAPAAAAANNFGYNDNNVDSGVHSKAPRLSHMQNSVSNTNTQYQPPGYNTMPGQYTNQASAAVTVGNTNYNQGGPSQNAPSHPIKALANRKPKSLLEQLVMMPNTSKDEEDIFNDDLMLELVEELLEKSGEVLQGNMGVYSNNSSNTFVARPHIKQEVVTPTSTDPPAPFSDFYQNSPQQFSGDNRPNNNRLFQPPRPPSNTSVHSEPPLDTCRSSPGLRQQQQQQQWAPSQPLQGSWQQQQQQQNSSQMAPQYQRPNNKGLSSQMYQQQRGNLQNLQNKQQTLPPYPYPRQEQQQQTHTSSDLQTAEQNKIYRELNDLIWKNEMQQQQQQQPPQQSINSDRLFISSAALPELGNLLDDELNNINQQTNSVPNQNINGNVTGDRKFSSMI